jgi:hypothetical protein
MRRAVQVRFVSRPGLDTITLASVLGTAVHEDRGGLYVIESEQSPKMTAALAAWLAEHDAELIELRTAATLEETYLALVGSRTEESGAAGGRRTRTRRGR